MTKGTSIRSSRFTLLLASTLLVGSCGGSGSTGPSATVSVSPTTLSLLVGETATLSVTVTGSSAAATFSSSRESVAEVSPSGVVLGVAPGDATITVSAGGATAQVTVEVAGVSVVFQGFTKDGQPIDPTALSGVVEAEIDVDAPAGFEGTLTVLFDDIEMGSVELPSANPPLSAGAGGPSRVPRREGILVATNAVTMVSSEEVQPLVLNGRDIRAFASLVPSVTGPSAVTAEFGGTVRTVNVDGVVIRDLSSTRGGYTLPSGVVVHSGDLAITAQPVSYDPMPRGVVSIEMIEVLMGGAHALYGGGPAVSGRVNIVVPGDKPLPEGTLNEDGSFQFGPGARVEYLDGAIFDRVILNLDSRAAPGLPSGFLLDNRPPEDDHPQVPSGWFGLLSDLKARADLSFVPFDRFGGIDRCELLAGLDLDNPEFTNFQFGSELRETASLELRWGADCWDLSGNVRRFGFSDGGGPSFLGGSYVTPTASWGAGSIQHRDSNPAGNFEVEAVDPTNSFGVSAGIDFDTWRLSRDVFAKAGHDCLVGTANSNDGCEAADPDYPFTSWQDPGYSPSAEIRTTVQIRNNAGTWSDPLVSWNIYDQIFPTLSGALTVADGIWFDKVDEGEAVTGLSGSDDLELSRFSLEGLYSGPVGVRNVTLGYINSRLGRRFDEDLSTPDFTLDATTWPSPRSMQYTKFTGLVWEPQEEILVPGEVRARLRDTTRQWTQQVFNVLVQVSPTAVIPFVNQLMSDYRFFGPSDLCNAHKGADCGGTPEEAAFSIQALTKGEFAFHRLILYGIPLTPGAEPVAQPLLDTQDLEVTDLGGGTKRLTASFLVNATALQLFASQYSLFVVAVTADNDGLMSNEVLVDILR